MEGDLYKKVYNEINYSSTQWIWQGQFVAVCLDLALVFRKYN